MAILKIYNDSINAGRCRSCEAPITWGAATNGKKHPLNGSPKDLAPIRSETEVESGRVVLYIDTTINGTHFETCPQGRDWRRK